MKFQRAKKLIQLIKKQNPISMDWSEAIDHVWRYLFLCFGLQISGDYYNPSGLRKERTIRERLLSVFAVAVRCFQVVSFLSCFYFIINEYLTSKAVEIVTYYGIFPISPVIASWNYLTILRSRDDLNFYLSKLRGELKSKYLYKQVCGGTYRNIVFVTLICVVFLVFCISSPTIYQLKEFVDETPDGLVSKPKHFHTQFILSWMFFNLLFNGIVVVLFSYMCDLLRANLGQLCDHANQVLRKEKWVPFSTVTYFEKNYERLYEYAWGVSNIFFPLLVVWSGENIIQMCMAVSSIKLDFHHEMMYAASYHCLVFVIFFVLFVTFNMSAASVETQARQTLDVIRELMCKEKSLKQSKKTKLEKQTVFQNDTRETMKQLFFLHQTSGKIASINMLGFYAITYKSTFSLLGVAITYILILFKI